MTRLARAFRKLARKIASTVDIHMDEKTIRKYIKGHIQDWASDPEMFGNLFSKNRSLFDESYPWEGVVLKPIISDSYSDTSGISTTLELSPNHKKKSSITARFSIKPDVNGNLQLRSGYLIEDDGEIHRSNTKPLPIKSVSDIGGAMIRTLREISRDSKTISDRE